MRRQRRPVVVAISIATCVITLRMYYMVVDDETNVISRSRKFYNRAFNYLPDDQGEFDVRWPSQPVCNQRYTKEADVDLNVNDLYDGLVQKSTNYEPKQKQSKYKHKKLTVFVVPHSHTDPGWLKTYSTYTNETNIELNNMLQFMPDNERMTFQWSEMAFMSKWWEQLSDEKKSIAKMLVNKKRFEPITGSWTMTDEANPIYYSSIDNIVEGFQWLKKELDYHPRTMWSNDPFGYGSTVSYLFKLADVRRMTIQRVHTSVKNEMLTRNFVPFHYRQLFQSSDDEPVLAHMLPGAHYDVLNTCGAAPGVCCQFDFKRLTSVYGCPGPRPTAINADNVENKSMMLYNAYRTLSRQYNVPVILVVLGDDFRYTEYSEWGQQHDNYVQLFDYMNAHYGIDIKFGIMSDYFDAVEALNISLPTVNGDFFPYTDGMDYWTGYFTSRPFLKRKERLLQERLYAADTLLLWSMTTAAHAFTNEQKTFMFDANRDSHRNLALFQHHDAITGTSKMAVMADYGLRLHQSLQNMSHSIELSVTSLTLPFTLKSDIRLPLTMGDYSLTSKERKERVPVTPIDKAVTLFIYNDVAHARDQLIAIDVISETKIVVVADYLGGRILSAQISPRFSYEERGGVDSTVFELSFIAPLQALALHKITLKFVNKQPNTTQIARVVYQLPTGAPEMPENLIPRIFQPSKANNQDGMHIKNSQLLIECDAQSGYLKTVQSEIFSRQRVKVGFFHYPGSNDGPYIFGPNGNAQELAINNNIFRVDGPVTSAVHVFSARLHHVARIAEIPGAAGRVVELSTTVDMQNIEQDEYVIRLSTDLVNDNNEFYTDANGLIMHRRRIGPSRLEANYYPMPSQAILQTDKYRLTVSADHPHGSTLLNKKTLEIMLDRTSRIDDRKGLGFDDGLMQDPLPVTSKINLLFEKRIPVAQANQQEYHPHYIYPSAIAHSAKETLLRPALIVQEMIKRDADGNPMPKTDFTPAPNFSSMLTPDLSSLPCDYEITSLRPVSDTRAQTWLLILHRSGQDCDIELPDRQRCDVDELSVNNVIVRLLSNLNVMHVVETDLSGVNERNVKALRSVDFTMAPNNFRTFKFDINAVR